MYIGAALGGWLSRLDLPYLATPFNICVLLVFFALRGEVVAAAGGDDDDEATGTAHGQDVDWKEVPVLPEKNCESPQVSLL